MVMSVYKKALAVLAKKPFKLWGISLLSGVLTTVLTFLFGATIGIALALNLLITTSMTMVYLYGYKGEDVKVVQLFDCFKDWATIKRVVCGMAWMSLWIFLWGLIPIVGVFFVIVKGYAYRLTPYILVHEQDIPLTEAIKVSEKRTKGFKGKMFLADFLPYVFIFVASLVLGLLCVIPVIGALLLFVFEICVIAFTPLFFGLVQAAFYVEIDNINKSGFNPYAQPAYAPQNPYGGNPYGGNPYGAPQQNPYSAPQQNPYGAPQQNPYGAPQQNPYGTPRTPYGAPQQNPYAQPQQNPYGAPQHNPYVQPQQPTQNPNDFQQ